MGMAVAPFGPAVGGPCSVGPEPPVVCPLIPWAFWVVGSGLFRNLLSFFFFFFLLFWDLGLQGRQKGGTWKYKKDFFERERERRMKLRRRERSIGSSEWALA